MTVRWLLVRGEPPSPVESWLGPWESQRASSLSFPPKRREFVLGRWACKRALAVALGVAPGPRLEVRAQPSGAPVPLLDGAPAPLRLSLSHRAGAALCALGPADAALGADLELIEPRSDGFVETFFTRSETHFASQDPPLLRNLIWSAKESALKALGEGLRRDTREVEIEPSLHASADGWRGLLARVAGRALPGFWRREGDLVVTIVAEGATSAPQRLSD